MVTRLARRPVTLAGTFSFYVPSTDSESLAVVGSLADAVTVKGPMGPAVVRALRAGSWDGRVIFDRGGYTRRHHRSIPSGGSMSRLPPERTDLLLPVPGLPGTPAAKRSKGPLTPRPPVATGTPKPRRCSRSTRRSSSWHEP